MVEFAQKSATTGLGQQHQHGARNLLHYVALRRHDIRDLQRELASLGLSSLGRTESHVLGTVRAVLHLLRNLQSGGVPMPGQSEQDRAEGAQCLERNTEALLGPAPAGRKVRIMVTMPSEAASDYKLVRNLVAAGMNCMRINCAHDEPKAWKAMVEHLRQAERETGKSCVVEMDVAGPKLRTGPIEPGPAVQKYRPVRDVFGRVKQPARIWLTPAESPAPPEEQADAAFPVPAKWLARQREGTCIRFTDTRGARRCLNLMQKVGASWWAHGSKTAYIAPGTRFSAPGKSKAAVQEFPPSNQTIPLEIGDRLILTRELAPGRPAQRDATGEILSPARIGVTLPEFFSIAQADDPIWLDDGAIGGVITRSGPDEVEIRITHTRPGGDKLGCEKGLNLPNADLPLPALTRDDLKALPFIAKYADIVGFSFVRTAKDVREMHRTLARLRRPKLGIVLKIETRRAFENLPAMLVEGMRGGPLGVMIARGDLAVECGFERLAEIQEEVLWVAEAAHVPVIWATQVLETLTKTGRPSRSEITDAAMGERAECVMLNKGPYIANAVEVLDDILVRMQAHQEKKTAMLRKLNVAAAFGETRRTKKTGSGH